MQSPPVSDAPLSAMEEGTAKVEGAAGPVPTAADHSVARTASSSQAEDANEKKMTASNALRWQLALGAAAWIPVIALAMLLIAWLR